MGWQCIARRIVPEIGLSHSRQFHAFFAGCGTQRYLKTSAVPNPILLTWSWLKALVAEDDVSQNRCVFSPIML
jgi:hypothetical protein